MLLPVSQVSQFQMGTPKAMNDAQAMQRSANKTNTVLVRQVTREADYLIYLYNILAGYDFPPVQQPPTFPNFKIPRCPKGEKFAFAILPAVVKNPIERNGAQEGTTEVSYLLSDGREATNSLCNPDAHPSNPFEAQFRDIEKFGNGDQIGNNLNAMGVFWSLASPYLDDQGKMHPAPGEDTKILQTLHAEGRLFQNPKLDEEIAAMRKRVDSTMRMLITDGDRLNAAGKLSEITPLMHFAMDYFNLEALWHRSHEHRVSCPNCSEPIRDGIAYHKNSMNVMCILDWQRAYEAGAIKKDDVPESKRWWEEQEAEPEPVAAGGKPKPKRRVAS